MRQVALLRGINLGPNRRIAMPALRERLQADYPGAQTYVQSGNIVLDADAPPDDLAAELAQRLRGWFGLDVPVLVRTSSELAEVVSADPLHEDATDPKRYTVTFLDREPAATAIERVAGSAADGERLVHRGRELYAWFPDGQARSKLSLALTRAELGVLATARNWTTVTTLEAMCRS